MAYVEDTNGQAVYDGEQFRGGGENLPYQQNDPNYQYGSNHQYQQYQQVWDFLFFESLN